MGIYTWVFQKWWASLFSRGNQACARKAKAKHRPTTQSWDAAIYIEGTRLTCMNWRVDLGNQFASLKTGQWYFWQMLRNNDRHISWCLWIFRSGFGSKGMPNLTLYFVHIECKWQEFSSFHTAVEAIFSAVCDHFWTKTSFSTSSFWGSNYHFLDDLDYLLSNVGVSFWFYPIEIHFGYEGFSHFFKFRSKVRNMTCYLPETGVEFHISTFFVNIFKNRSKFQKMKKLLIDNFILFLKINESHICNKTKLLLCFLRKTRSLPWLLMNS